MVQNLMSSAFETITTVQEGVEILDIFQHLSSREVKSSFLHSLHYQLKTLIYFKYIFLATKTLKIPHEGLLISKASKWRRAL